MSTPAETSACRPGKLQGSWVFEPKTIGDERGFFREAFRLKDLELVMGEVPRALQTNHARSTQRVLRGLHAENWEKLVFAPHGEVFVVLVDIRPDSPTFAQVDTYTIGESNPLTIYVPRGLAHGYYVHSETADYVYQVTSYYDGSDTRAVAWDDPDLAVPWPDRDPIISVRDTQNPTMRELFPDRFPRA